MPSRLFHLPDFAIIGANKGGTTTLAEHFARHPQVDFCRFKEPMFFSSAPSAASARPGEASLGAPYFAARLDEYSLLFKGTPGLSKGEASTAYLCHPFEVANWMAKLTPNIKIIAVLRHPVDRAWSAYQMCVRQGLEKRPFHQIVREARQTPNIKARHSVQEYFLNGLYAQQLAPFYRLLGRENICVGRYEDLVGEPQSFFDRLCDFLGLRHQDIETNLRLNARPDSTSAVTERPNVADALELHGLYQTDVEETQKLTGLDLTAWMQPGPSRPSIT